MNSLRTAVRFAASFAAVLLSSITASHVQAQATNNPSAATTAPTATAATDAWKPPQRRRIYLMRHGDVAYFDAQGKPVSEPDLVSLSEKGRAQAEAAGKYLAALGVKKLDRVYASSLPRTQQTAALVVGAAGITTPVTVVETWREMKSGGSSNIPTANLPRAFLELAAPRVPGSARFGVGESVHEVQDRVLPKLHELQADPAWDNALLVLHGLVNNVILSHALGAGNDYFGRIEHSPGCINVLDMGATPGDWVVRAINLCPDAGNYADGVPGARLSTLEKLLAGSLRARSSAASKQ
jgi:broad specificity phosphatase PhoE